MMQPEFQPPTESYQVELAISEEPEEIKRIAPTDSSAASIAITPAVLEQLRQQAERERLLRAIAQRIRQSLELETILQTTVTEVRQFLQVDRVLIYRFSRDWQGTVLVESVIQSELSLKGQDITDPCLPEDCAETYRQGKIRAIHNVYHSQLPKCYLEFLHRLQVMSHLTVPILQGEQLWGLLLVQNCQSKHYWQDTEIELLEQLATQVAIAIQQSELYRQVQQLNADLEEQVHRRTSELERALAFESLLKRITDKVRQSLDETQILQAAVQELTLVLGIQSCNAALYDLDQGTSTIGYEYTRSGPGLQGRVLLMSSYPKLYQQLLQGHYAQFCSLNPNHDRGQVALLAYPIQEKQQVLGDLWLVKDADGCFSASDLRLVEQVANQCAIAIRQARLYQTAQFQVGELEKLNAIKDDFLSTVSHELRTPLANMRMAIELLDKSADSQKRDYYLQVLRSECLRETQLINDLLDLQRLNSATTILSTESIELKSWLVSLVRAFESRAQERQQTLHLQIPDTLPVIYSDSASLSRVISELLNNACKYTIPGGRISLNVHYHSPNYPFDLQQQPECGVTFTVRNQAEIPPQQLPHIFDKFYRVPNADRWKQGGTGLGLALIKELVERLGGKIWAESHAGWTAFTVQLPPQS